MLISEELARPDRSPDVPPLLVNGTHYWSPVYAALAISEGPVVSVEVDIAGERAMVTAATGSKIVVPAYDRAQWRGVISRGDLAAHRSSAGARARRLYLAAIIDAMPARIAEKAAPIVRDAMERGLTPSLTHIYRFCRRFEEVDGEMPNYSTFKMRVRTVTDRKMRMLARAYAKPTTEAFFRNLRMRPRDDV